MIFPTLNDLKLEHSVSKDSTVQSETLAGVKDVLMLRIRGTILILTCLNETMKGQPLYIKCRTKYLTFPQTNNDETIR